MRHTRLDAHGLCLKRQSARSESTHHPEGSSQGGEAVNLVDGQLVRKAPSEWYAFTWVNVRALLNC
jgi:hypothetical protein